LNTRFNTLESKNILIFSLITVAIIYLIGNIVNQEEFFITEDKYMTDVFYIIIPIIIIILGVILVLRYGVRGNHSIAWILFTLTFVCWSIGENTYNYDYDYDIENISTLTSDIFYIIGYPLFFAFTIFYLIPRKQIISKNIIIISGLISLLIVIPTLYFTFDIENEKLDGLTIFLYAIYPILDALIIIPSIIATILFFRGKVNLLWTMVLLGTILWVVADTSYLIFSVDDSYYPGHPLDMLFNFAYILWAFGAYSHIKLYKKSESNFT